MSRLFHRLGVDYAQWRALARAHLLIDYAAILGAYGSRAAGRAIRDALLVFVGFGLLGAGPALLIWLAHDGLVGSLVLVTVMGGFSAFFALHETTSVALPVDYDIVGFRPVGSRTYFAVRMTAVLWRTFEVAAGFGYLPCLALLARSDGSPAVAAAGAVTVLLAVVTTTLCAVGATARLLGVLPADRVEQMSAVVIAVAAFLFSVPMILGVVGLADVIMPEGPATGLVSVHVPRTWLLVALPPYWFAAIVEAARAGASAIEATGVAFACAAVAASLFLLQGRLSLGYAARLAEIATSSTPRRDAAPPAWPWLRGEARAVALVARAQLRSDTTLLSTLALNLLIVGGFLFVGPSGGLDDLRTDPFLPGAGRVVASSFVFVYLVWMIPRLCVDALVTTSRVEPSWFFYTTPADRVAIVSAMRNMAAVLVIVPLTTLIAVVLAWAWGHIGHAVLHALVLGAVGFVVLQGWMLVSPAMPFSRQADRPRSGAGFRLGAMPVYVVGTLGAVFLWVAFQRLLYPSVARTIAGLAGLALLMAGLNACTRRRVAKRAASFWFPG